MLRLCGKAQHTSSFARVTLVAIMRSLSFVYGNYEQDVDQTAAVRPGAVFPVAVRVWG